MPRIQLSPHRWFPHHHLVTIRFPPPRSRQSKLCQRINQTLLYSLEPSHSFPQHPVPTTTRPRQALSHLHPSPFHTRLPVGLFSDPQQRHACSYLNTQLLLSWDSFPRSPYSAAFVIWGSFVTLSQTTSLELLLLLPYRSPIPLLTAFPSRSRLCTTV